MKVRYDIVKKNGRREPWTGIFKNEELANKWYQTHGQFWINLGYILAPVILHEHILKKSANNSENIKRYQRSNKKGYIVPANSVHVDAPSKWACPLKLMGDTIFINANHRRKILSPWVILKENATMNDLIDAYKKLWSNRKLSNYDMQHWQKKLKEMPLHELKGMNLVSWCKLDQPSYVDVLIEIANKK
jgi:hypothetical protein